MKERFLSKTPFLTFVYISKCNINLPGYFGNSKKRFLWTGLMVIIGHRSSKITSRANNCLCFSPHENVIIFSRTMFYVISFVRGPQKDRLFPFISFPFSHSIFGLLVFSRKNTNMHLFYQTQVRLFSTYEAVSDQGPVWVQREAIFQGSCKAFLNGKICSNYYNMM